MLELLHELKTEFGVILFLKGYKDNLYYPRHPELKIAGNSKMFRYGYQTYKTYYLDKKYVNLNVFKFYRSNYVVADSEISDLPKFRNFFDIPIGIRYQEDFKEIYDSIPDFDDPYEDLIILGIYEKSKIDSLLGCLKNSSVKSNKEFILTCNTLETFGFLNSLPTSFIKKYDLKYRIKIKKFKDLNLKK